MTRKVVRVKSATCTVAAYEVGVLRSGGRPQGVVKEYWKASFLWPNRFQSIRLVQRFWRHRLPPRAVTREVAILAKAAYQPCCGVRMHTVWMDGHADQDLQKGALTWRRSDLRLRSRRPQPVRTAAPRWRSGRGTVPPPASRAASPPGQKL